jgi:hypothetical protein
MRHKSIRRYTHRDYPMIKEWYEKRGKTAPQPAQLSDTGYIADGRVCGFLYLTNSNMAMIEGIVANPDTVPSLRRASLTRLIGFMIDTALLLGYENIFGIGKHPSITEEAKRFGFHIADWKLYMLDKSLDAIKETEEVSVAGGYGYSDEEY